MAPDKWNITFPCEVVRCTGLAQDQDLSWCHKLQQHRQPRLQSPWLSWINCLSRAGDKCCLHCSCSTQQSHPQLSRSYLSFHRAPAEWQALFLFLLVVHNEAIKGHFNASMNGSLLAHLAFTILAVLEPDSPQNRDENDITTGI